ncbi:hypothetical protein H1R20_g12315, partial [Candolleomyces eurysporus]
MQGEREERETVDKNVVAIGIDIGTQYCRVAVWQNSHPVIVPDEEGNRAMPNYVSFGDARLIGSGAKARQAVNTRNTAYGVKGLLGRNYRDPHSQEFMKMAPFTVINKGGYPHVQVEHLGKQEVFAPEEIIAMQLSKLKSMAQTFAQSDNLRVAVSIPAGFSALQRQAISDACEIAGLPDPLLIHEPAAAALYYTFYSQENPHTSAGKETLLVDIGAGTTSATVMTVDDGVVEMLAVASNVQLGGDDFDRLLAKYVVAELKTTQSVDIGEEAGVRSRLLSACERAKRALSVAQTASVDLEGLGLSERIKLPNLVIKRDQFDTLCNGLYAAILKLVQDAITQSGVRRTEIREVLLIGGATRTPGVVASILKFFEGSTPTLIKIQNLDEAVVYGLTIYSAALSEAEKSAQAQKVLDNMVVVDGIHHPISIAVIPNPDSSSEDAMDYLPPDGASPHECVLKTIMERNKISPSRECRAFSMARGDQTTAHIQIYEGADDDPDNNVSLGYFELHGIPKSPSPGKRSEVKVCVETDARGRTVVATASYNSKKGSAARTVPICPGRLAHHTKREMIQRVGMLDEHDRIYEAQTLRRNNLEGYCYNAPGSIEELKRGVDRCLRRLDDTGLMSLSDEELALQEELLVALARRVLPPGYAIVRQPAWRTET